MRRWISAISFVILAIVLVVALLEPVVSTAKSVKSPKDQVTAFLKAAASLKAEKTVIYWVPEAGSNIRSYLNNIPPKTKISLSKLVPVVNSETADQAEVSVTYHMKTKYNKGKTEESDIQDTFTLKKINGNWLISNSAFTNVSLDPAQTTLSPGQTCTFTARALDSYNNPLTGLVCTLRADQMAGQLDNTGLFTAVTKAGTYDTAITSEATQGSVTKSATARIIIEPGSYDHVLLSPQTLDIDIGQNQQFTAYAADTYDNPISGSQTTWKAAEGIGTIKDDGTYTSATKAGTYDTGITAEVTQGGVTKSATAKVVIKPGPLDHVTLSPNSVSMDISQSQQFTVAAVDSYENAIPDAQITWKITDGIGTVKDNAFTTGTKAGKFEPGITVTAQVGEVSKQSVVSVTIKPGPFEKLSIATVQIATDKTQQLEAIAADHYNNKLDEVSATWTVVDQNAGSATQTGLLTPGQVAGTYDDAVEARIAQNGETHTVKAPVEITAGPLEQVIVAPNPADIGIGMTQQFVAVGADKYGNRITGLSFTWSVVNGGGTISKTGMFTAGTTPGIYENTVKAQITLNGSTFSGTASVTVEPDRIAFISDRNNDQYDVYIMSADGTEVKRLTNTENLEWSCSWSPDGRRIAYDSVSYEDGIRITNDDSGWDDLFIQNTLISNTSSEITEVDSLFPDWSPDGTKIVFVATLISFTVSTADYQSGAIWVLDIDGGNLKKLTDTPTTTITYWSPQWSPDGTKIAYNYTVSGQGSDIYVMNADGSNKHALTNDPANDTHPVWSPDGTKIAFASDRDGDYDIYVMNSDGSNLRQLTFNSGIEDSQPSWSPDGNKIVLASDRDISDRKTYEIYVIDADGNNVARLTNDSADDANPCWAPRKHGVEVIEASVIIPNASTLKAKTVQTVTALTRKAVVRIETDQGSGSGFIVDPGGLILTCNHVITDAEKITVYLENGTSYKGTIQSRDMEHDLAVIKIEATGLPYLKMGDLSQVSLGQQVVVLGYPLGTKSISVTSGLVSAIDYDSGSNINWIKTDAAVNSGNSGGPMLDLQGQVIGVVQSHIVGSGVEGQGYAVSVNTVRTYITLAIPTATDASTTSTAATTSSKPTGWQEIPQSVQNQYKVDYYFPGAWITMTTQPLPTLFLALDPTFFPNTELRVFDLPADVKTSVQFRNWIINKYPSEKGGEYDNFTVLDQGNITLNDGTKTVYLEYKGTKIGYETQALSVMITRGTQGFILTGSDYPVVFADSKPLLMQILKTFHSLTPLPAYNVETSNQVAPSKATLTAASATAAPTSITTPTETIHIELDINSVIGYSRKNSDTAI